MWSEHVAYRDVDGSSRIRKDLDHALTGHDMPQGYRDMFRAAVRGGRQVNVAIVGAGLAGLRCADVLLQHGCKVTIFEARGRVGGRVAQSDVLGRPVDLGPNWIHGDSDNPILDIARSTGTGLHTWDETQRVIGTDGVPLDRDEAVEYGRLIWEDVLPNAFRYSNEKQDSIPAEKSLYDYFIEKSQGYFLNDPKDVAERKRETLLQAATVWGAYVGSPVSRQSLKFFWLEECIEGENPFVAGTYTKILEHVAAHAVKKATIHLNTPVKAIISDPSSDNTTPPQLQLAKDDTLHTFDEIIVTTPLGYLKYHPDFFQPPPPLRFTQAISNLGYGSLDKLYATFTTPFWADSSNATLPSFTHFLSPTYAQDTNPGKWDLQAMDLSALTPASTAHPTLLFYIYGDCATHIAQIVTSATSPSALQASLTQFLHPYISRLPNYSSSNPDCTPTKVLATAWAADEFAGFGSYANFQVGLQKGDEDVEVLRWGLPERGVWVAGEHTAPFVALGTSTGAWWSGDSVGRRILGAYGLEIEGKEGETGKKAESGVKAKTWEKGAGSKKEGNGVAK